MSNVGRAQDTLWEVLKRFGIDPKMKVEGHDTCLLDDLVNFSHDVWFFAGVKQGEHNAVKALGDLLKERLNER